MPQAHIESEIHKEGDLSATYNQVRLRVRSLVGPMSGQIEQAADQIISGTTNSAVQRAALLWKAEGVPAMRAALFQPNPYTALFDSWVLCYQMQDYFQTGQGKKSMGEASSIALATSQHMEEEMNRVAASLTKSGDVTKARAFAQNWAREHPIRYSIADRESTLSRALEREGITSVSALESVAEMTVAMDDLNRRLEIYSNQLFSQARWQADLFKSDLMADLPVAEVLSLAERVVKSAEQASTNFDRLIPSIERTVELAENTPKLIATEREAAVRAMDDELTRSIEFVNEERIVAFEYLTEERIAALKDLQRMMTAERKSLTEEIGQISLKVVDHAFWRATQLIVAILALFLIGAVAIAFIVRKRVQI